MTRSATSPTALLLLALLAAAPASAQRPASSIVIVTGGEPSMPIPTLMEGAQNQVANFEVADHLFLRLANLGPGRPRGRPHARAGPSARAGGGGGCRRCGGGLPLAGPLEHGHG